MKRYLQDGARAAQVPPFGAHAASLASRGFTVKGWGEPTISARAAWSFGTAAAHTSRVADTEFPVDPPANGRMGDVQIRTFLIADVRGYTLFTQERGDEAAAKLAAKFADIAREIVEARGGTLLELRGDEALCVFASTREAIRAAVDLQQRFVEETLEQPELPLTVGIGLDAGEAVPVQGGYRGAALNLAARLCGQARAGEILATREVTHLARRIEDAQIRRSRFADLQGHRRPGRRGPRRSRRRGPGRTPPALRARAASAAHETLATLGCDRCDRRGARTRGDLDPAALLGRRRRGGHRDELRRAHERGGRRRPAHG